MILGSRMPRIYTPELRPLTPETSLGFEAIDLWHDVMGLELLPHQEEWLIRSLELAPDSTTADEFPRLRFRTVLTLEARQNGKTYKTTARALWRMLMWRGPGEPAPVILGLAHKLGPTEEILEKAIQLLRANPQTRPMIAQRSNTNGNKFVRLTNGARWFAQAANDDAGRSESVTDLLFDELRQQKDWDAWTAAENTINAIYSSQALATSNAGEAKSIVLRGLRESAIREAESLRAWIDEHGSSDGWDGDPTVCILEWSAPDGADIRDLEALAQANPAMNRVVNGRTMITTEMLLSKASRVGIAGEEGVPEHKFRTENMCQWVTVASEPMFPPDDVEACTDDSSSVVDGSELVYAVDVSKDRKTAWVGVAGWRDDERIHAEVIAKLPGTHAVLGFLKNLETPGPVVIQGRGAPASSLVSWLVAEGIDVRRCEGTETTNALSQMDDALREGTIRFRPQQGLLRAMQDATRRQAGEVFLLDRYNSPVDASPLAIVMLARWGLANLESTAPAISAYADDEYGTWYAPPTDDDAADGDDDDGRWWE